MYLNYVRNGYDLPVIMHKQGLKSSEHVLVKYFFTNEHKAVFSKNEELRYIDINDFKIFKESSKDSETVFKIKPISVKFIKMINVKKDKDVDDNYLKKIKEYVGRIENTFCLLCNCVPEIQKDNFKICSLFYKLQFNETNKKDMLKKINDTINNSLDTIWRMLYEKDERLVDKILI